LAFSRGATGKFLKMALEKQNTLQIESSQITSISVIFYRNIGLPSFVHFLKKLVGFETGFPKAAYEYGRIFLIFLFCLASMVPILFLLNLATQ